MAASFRWVASAILGAVFLLAGRPFSATAAATTTNANSQPWWSLRPLARPPWPAADLGTDPVSSRNPIDVFIRADLAAKGLRPSPPADRATLIRRVYFDLIGLPPTPEEVERFVAEPSRDAYEKLVDRLLASPRYGERWARHWLDIVHFGETHGYDKDKPRPNAWPYRDYVIRAWNSDKPYTRFVQEQIAGDVLFPFTRDGVEALGFISAGPWDLIGHEEVPETKIDGKIARHLDRDDMVANTMQTFNSMTVQCAQCHNHKFDPISQEDYYSLQAVFAAVDRTNRKYDTDAGVARVRASLEGRQHTLAAQLEGLHKTIVERAGAPLRDLDARIAALEKPGRKGDAYGYHSAIEKKPDLPKWVQIDLGRAVELGNIVLHPCRDDFNGIGEGFGFPPRFTVAVSEEAEFKGGGTIVADHSGEDLGNPRLRPQSFDAAGRSARYIRITTTKLALRQDDYIFALAEVQALTSDGRNAALGATVTALDSIEAPARWQKSNLTDGWYPGIGGSDTNELAALRRGRTNLVAAARRPDEAQKIAELEKALAQAKAQLSKLPEQSVAYVGAVHQGSGSFRGTGPDGGKPRTIHILNRGNVEKPGAAVDPGALSCLDWLKSRFELAPDAGEGDRRAALARWLTDPGNPLTWRSIVNRIWLYHFGRGLVETPGDFGRMGSLPTHPELLDWLAVEFRDGGQSLKRLHRLIVLSETYRQTSAHDPAAAAIDADNRYLWRMNRRKLEAEAVRDSVLAVAGHLNLRLGGPSFQDFIIDKPEHSPHYEYQQHDPNDPKAHRRAIYRFIVRSQQEPFMTALDCADPSLQVAHRNESVSPLQSLALLNNALMVAMSREFAARLEQGAGDLAAKVARAHYEACGRPPAPAAAAALVAYAREFGLPNLCRLLFNLNEFSFID